MKIILCFLIIALISCSEDPKMSTEYLYPFRSNSGKYGFVDKDGNIVVNADFQMAKMFVNNYGIVKNKEHNILINLNSVKVSDEYDQIFHISRAIFLGKNDENYYIIKPPNNIINRIPFKVKLEKGYASSLIPSFINNWLVIKIDKHESLYNVKNNNIYKMQFDSIKTKKSYSNENFPLSVLYIYKNNRVGLLDSNLNMILLPKYDFISYYKDNIAVINNQGKFGLVNEKGNLITEVVYDELAYYNNNKLLINQYNEFIEKFHSDIFFENVVRAKKEDKWGFLNSKGEITIPFIYEDVMDFNEGLAPVKKNNKWGLIDKKNSIIIPFIYEAMNMYSEGIIWVKKDNQWFPINKNNKTVLNTKYDQKTDYYNFNTYVYIDGVSKVIKENKYGLINKNGNYIIPPKNHDIIILPHYKYYLVENAGKYDIINKKGSKIKKDIIQYLKYNKYISIYFDGNEYGIINKDGVILDQVEVKSFDIRFIYNDYFYIKNPYALYNSKGKIIFKNNS